jgi:hypothetical protein
VELEHVAVALRQHHQRLVCRVSREGVSVVGADHATFVSVHAVAQPDDVSWEQSDKSDPDPQPDGGRSDDEQDHSPGGKRDSERPQKQCAQEAPSAVHNLCRRDN